MLFRPDKPDDKPPNTLDMALPGLDALGKAGAPAGAPDAAAAKIIAERKQRRDAGIASGARSSKLSESEKTLLATFEKLYEPEVWEGVVCAPADTMLAVSGRKLWNMSGQERKTLSITASVTARCFAVENPKWLALAMLAITIAQIYGVRAAMHFAEMKAERNKATAAVKEATK
jgi:hypothetical protein